MSGNDGTLVYNFGSIENLSAAVASFVGQMNATLEEVDSTFRNLLANGWQGAAADAFQGCSSQWHEGAQQMAETLQRLGQKVGNAGASMQQADAANAGLF